MRIGQQRWQDTPMMNPGLGTSLTRASIALQVLSILVLLVLWLMAAQALATGAGPGVVGNLIWLGIALPVPLWFFGLCGKVIADLHGYCYWAQENTMANEARVTRPLQ
jgi:hypothetical protein